MTTCLQGPPVYKDHILVSLENGFSLKHLLKEPVYKDHFLCFPCAVAIDRFDWTTLSHPLVLDVSNQSYVPMPLIAFLLPFLLLLSSLTSNLSDLGKLADVKEVISSGIKEGVVDSAQVESLERRINKLETEKTELTNRVSGKNS